MSSFSITQQVLLAVAPKVSASLSLLGSSWIIIEVLTDKLKNTTVFHRLLFAMSSFDIISSAAFFASTWPIPKFLTENVIWNIGNISSCHIQGFLLQLGIASPIYNSHLAFYYMLIIRFGYTESMIRDKFEIIMHFLTAILAVLPAFAALQLNLYHPATVWCWMAPPSTSYQEAIEECEQEQQRYDVGDDYIAAGSGDSQISCSSQATSSHLGWIFYFVVIWLCCLLSIGCLVSTYRAIRKRELERGIKPRRGSLDVLKIPTNLDDRRRSRSQSNTGRRSSIDESSFTTFTADSFLMDNNSRTSFVGSNNRRGSIGMNVSWGRQQSQSSRNSISPSRRRSSEILSSPVQLETSFQRVQKTSAAEKNNDTPATTTTTIATAPEKSSSRRHRSTKNEPRPFSSSSSRQQRLSFMLPPISSSVPPRRTSSLQSKDNACDRGGGVPPRRQGSLPTAPTRSRASFALTVPKTTLSLGATGTGEGIGMGSLLPGRLRRKSLAQTRKELFLKEWQEAKDAEAVIQAISQIKSSTRLASVATSYASRQVYEQALLYTVAFIITYSFATINRIVQEVTGKIHFSLVLLHVFFIALQGALNFLVYRRMAYRRLQLQYPHLSWWQTFMRTWRWSFLGPPKPNSPSMVDDENHYPSISEQFKRSALQPSNQPPIDTDSPFCGDDCDNAAMDSSPSSLDESHFDYVVPIAGDEPNDLGVFQDILADEEVNRAVDNYMSGYAEFPNLLTEEDDDEMVESSFPVIRLHEEPYPSDSFQHTDCFTCNREID